MPTSGVGRSDASRAARRGVARRGVAWRPFVGVICLAVLYTAASEPPINQNPQHVIRAHRRRLESGSRRPAPSSGTEKAAKQTQRRSSTRETARPAARREGGEKKKKTSASSPFPPEGAESRRWPDQWQRSERRVPTAACRRAWPRERGRRHRRRRLAGRRGGERVSGGGERRSSASPAPHSADELRAERAAPRRAGLRLSRPPDLRSAVPSACVCARAIVTATPAPPPRRSTPWRRHPLPRVSLPYGVVI